MKVIKYRFLSCEINHGTEENPDVEQRILPKTVYCETEASFNSAMEIALRESYNEETPIVEGEFDPEPDTASTDDILNALLGVTV